MVKETNIQYICIVHINNVLIDLKHCVVIYDFFFY